jgi:hypothetical protein
MSNLKLLAVLLFAVVFAAPSFADPYRVRGVTVDATGANAQEAQLNARRMAQVNAAERLIRRLTLPEDRSAAAQPILATDVARFFNGVDTEGDTKSTGTRFFATYAIGFDAKAVRQYFDSRNVPFVDSQAGLALVVPGVVGAMDASAWSAAWTAGADNTSLTPFVVSRSYGAGASYESAQAEARGLNALRIINAQAFVQNGQIYSRMIELRPGGQSVDLGVSGPYPTLQGAQEGAASALEDAWKKSSIVRTSGSATMELVARFDSLDKWMSIRQGLKNSRLIKDISIEAMSSRGADLNVVYAGRPDQLAADLRSRGLQLAGATGGWTIESAYTTQ